MPNLTALKAVDMFRAEKMVVAVCQETGYFVVDRRRMNGKQDGKAKMHNPYQLLSPDQKHCVLFRKEDAAVAALRSLKTIGRLQPVELQTVLAYASQEDKTLAA